MGILKILAAASAGPLADHRDSIAAMVVDLWDKYGEPFDLPGLHDTMVDPLVRSVLVKATGPVVDALAKKLAEFATQA